MRIALAVAVMVFAASCERGKEVCPERQPSGAELIRGADVVLVGTAKGGEVTVHSVLQGRLRELADRGALRVDGVPDGLAIVPLRLVEGRYRTVAGCWTPVIPLAWRPADGLGLREILRSDAPAGMTGPITLEAERILGELPSL